MKLKGFMTIICLLLMLAAAGCHTPARVTTASEPLCFESYDTADIMKAAETVLVDKKFTIEKFDVGNGYIVTRPMRGSQSFEFWRHDNVGKFNKGISSNQSIQRIVELEVLQGSGDLCISCYAHLRKLSMANDNFITLANSHRTYTSSGREVMRLTPSADEIDWVEMGRDYELESDILAKIKLNITHVTGDAK